MAKKTTGHMKSFQETNRPTLEIAASFLAILSSAAAWNLKYFGLGCFLYVGAMFIVLLSDSWKHRELSYRTVLLFPFTLYAFTPIAHIGLEGNIFLLSESIALYFLVGSWITLVILYWTLPTQEFLINRIKSTSVEYSNDRSPFSVLALICCIMFGAYLYTSILGSSGMSRGERISGQGFVQTASELGFISLNLLLFCQAIGNRSSRWIFPFVLAVAYFCVEIFYFGDRRTAFSLLLAFVVAAQCAGRLNLKTWQVLTPLSFLPVVLVFGVLRAYPLSDWVYLITSGKVFDTLSLMNSELGASSVIANTVGLTEGVFSWHPSYHLIPLQLVPTSFVPRDDWLWSPSQRYAYQYEYKLFASGGAVGYNILLESMQNFSVFGPAILAITLSRTFVWIASMKYQNKLFLLGVYTYATVFVYRSDLNGWVQTFVYIGVIGLVISAFIAIFFNNRQLERALL
ncbi:MAG: hypothetical protein H0W71_01525 [Sphingomonas sp.]|nr:hypothetical protein [Sphingomonas sp.]